MSTSERRPVSRKGSAAVFTALLRVTPKRRAKIVVHSVPDFEDGALAVLDALLERGHEPMVLLDEPLAPDTYDWGLAARGVCIRREAERPWSSPLPDRRDRLHHPRALPRALAGSEPASRLCRPRRAAREERRLLGGGREDRCVRRSRELGDRKGLSLRATGAQTNAGPGHRGTEKRPAAARRSRRSPARDRRLASRRHVDALPLVADLQAQLRRPTRRRRLGRGDPARPREPPAGRPVAGGKRRRDPRQTASAQSRVSSGSIHPHPDDRRRRRCGMRVCRLPHFSRRRIA